MFIIKALGVMFLLGFIFTRLILGYGLEPVNPISKEQQTKINQEYQADFDKWCNHDVECRKGM